MRGKRIVPVFLSALMLPVVTLCACSTQKNTESSSKIEVTTAAQTVTEQITTVETTAEEPSTEIPTIKEQETAAPVTETVQNDSWKQIYSDYVNSLSNFDNYDYALEYVDDDDIPEEATAVRAKKAGKKRRPHARRAHWQHYWTGEGRKNLELRWKSDLFVGASRDDQATVVYEVSKEPLKGKRNPNTSKKKRNK